MVIETRISARTQVPTEAPRDSLPRETNHVRAHTNGHTPPPASTRSRTAHGSCAPAASCGWRLLVSANPNNLAGFDEVKHGAGALGTDSLCLLDDRAITLFRASSSTAQFGELESCDLVIRGCRCSLLLLMRQGVRHQGLAAATASTVRTVRSSGVWKAPAGVMKMILCNTHRHAHGPADHVARHCRRYRYQESRHQTLLAVLSGLCT